MNQKRLINFTGLIVVILLLIVFATWRQMAKNLENNSAYGNNKSHINHKSTDRNSPHKSARSSVDTGALRIEALEILGRMKPLSNVSDMMEDAARLSSIFRKWGGVDFEEAKRFLETEEVANKLLTEDRTFADELLFAALIGYSKADPVGAWEGLLARLNKEQRTDWAYLPTQNVATEQIMRALFKKSEKLALQMLRGLDKEHIFMIAPSLRAIMSESNDAGFREDLLKEFYDVNMLYRRGFHASKVISGLAEHDPQMAWELLVNTAEEIVASKDLKMTLGAGLFKSWSQRQPEEALRFIAEYKGHEMSDNYRAHFLRAFIKEIYYYHPELIVEAFEMDSLKQLQDHFMLKEVKGAMDVDFPWPLIDENVPLSRYAWSQRFRHAVEVSSLSESLKKKFLAAIELKMVK